MKTRYKIMTSVRSIEEVEQIVRAHKKGDDVILEKENMGWYVCFEGSWERMYLGNEKPALKIGQKVMITVEGL